MFSSKRRTCSQDAAHERLEETSRMTQSSGSIRNARGDIVFVFALALACYLAWLVRQELVLLYVSALFAVVLSPVVRFTARLRVGRWKPFQRTAVLILLLALAAAITGFGFLALPPVIRDLQAFSGEMPARLPGVLEKLKQVPFADRLNTAEISTRVEDLASQAVTGLLYSIRDWAGGLFQVITGFILTVYFILEGSQA
jgi:predicted PurR-regulated permease PerM